MNAQLVQKAIVEDAWDRLFNLVDNKEDDDREHDDAPIGKHNNYKPHQFWWEPTTATTGWTVVHFAAAHFVPIEWWKWIVWQASRSDPTAFYKQRTALGETVFDIFFKTFLNPLPWESLKVKKRSALFHKALSLVMRFPKFLKCVRKTICSDWTKTNHFVVDEFVSFDDALDLSTTAPFPSSIDRVSNFLIHLKFLCKASMKQTGSTQQNRSLIGEDDNDDEEWILHMLSAGINCPKIIAELLVAVFPCVLTRIQKNPQPFHEWCCCPRVECTNEPDGLVEVLLRDCPELAMHCNPRTGRLPLEEALSSGRKSWNQVKPLFIAAPIVLQDDRYEKLPVFAWAAVTAAVNDTAKDTVVTMMARRSVVRHSGLVSLWCLATPSVQQRAITKAQQDYDCALLTTIFESLIACPMALIDTIQ